MFRVAIEAASSIFGPSYRYPKGYLGMPGESTFWHRFGGDSWEVADSLSDEAKPSLILTLDLTDPLVSDLHGLSLNELPLCSYIGYDIGASAQFFRIDPFDKCVTCVQRGKLEPRRRVVSPQPLEEKSLTLVPMTEEDYPTSESAYWSASDHFLGGGRFIRILGPPLWLYGVEIVRCECGREMKYVGAMGYESSPPYSQLIKDQPVFLGRWGFTGSFVSNA